MPAAHNILERFPLSQGSQKSELMAAGGVGEWCTCVGPAESPAADSLDGPREVYLSHWRAWC